MMMSLAHNQHCSCPCRLSPGHKRTGTCTYLKIAWFKRFFKYFYVRILPISECTCFWKLNEGAHGLKNELNERRMACPGVRTSRFLKKLYLFLSIFISFFPFKKWIVRQKNGGKVKWEKSIISRPHVHPPKCSPRPRWLDLSITLTLSRQLIIFILAPRYVHDMSTCP